MNHFAIELKDLAYDAQEILAFSNGPIPQWQQWTSTSGVTAAHRTCLLGTVDIAAIPWCRSILDRLNPVLDVHMDSMSIVRFPPNYRLSQHVDPVRQAAIILPLSPDDPAPISWYQGSVPVHHHVYKCATIINTQRYHAVNNDERERVTVHIDLMLPWSIIQELSLQGSLLI